MTGLVNHYVAFDAMTLSRHAWMSAHNILGIVFAVFGVWHAVLNRGALLRYLGGIRQGIAGSRREATFAAALVSGLVLLVVGHALHGPG